MREQAKRLMDVVFRSPTLSQTVFLESLSKSHGLCRERLGLYFTSDLQLFTRLHAANIGFSAGPGLVKDFQFAAVAASTAADKRGIDSLHLFWRDERRALVQFLLQNKFSDLFESEQPHLQREDLENPCTLYILLKTRPGVTSNKVFERTGALGVDTVLGSGHYVRYAVGMLTGPVYSNKT